MKNSILFKFKHTRKVNNEDNYFVIKVKLDGIYNEIGWIDPVFKKEKFLSTEPVSRFEKIEIIEVVSFKNKYEYEKYRAL